jgi:hypothetical protein
MENEEFPLVLEVIGSSGSVTQLYNISTRQDEKYPRDDQSGTS